ncbi:MAG: universal stress protein [Firmicutes bacterium]|nr:universal stress protein [Bacillota bacterium]
MYKYLLAVDGSENSERAAKYLLEVASNHKQMEITVLSIRESAAWFSNSMQDVIEKTAAEFKKAGIEVKTLVKEGTDPGELIAETADELNAGHIVMGVRGLGQVKGLFLGSVSQKVVQLCKCPITLVK